MEKCDDGWKDVADQAREYSEHWRKLAFKAAGITDSGDGEGNG